MSVVCYLILSSPFTVEEMDIQRDDLGKVTPLKELDSERHCSGQPGLRLRLREERSAGRMLGQSFANALRISTRHQHQGCCWWG